MFFLLLCVCVLRTGVYEVGVHIADVSYFIQEDTPLDNIAASRANSVYLVQKVSSATNNTFLSLSNPVRNLIP